MIEKNNLAETERAKPDEHFFLYLFSYLYTTYKNKKNEKAFITFGCTMLQRVALYHPHHLKVVLLYYSTATTGSLGAKQKIRKGKKYTKLNQTITQVMFWQWSVDLSLPMVILLIIIIIGYLELLLLFEENSSKTRDFATK